MLARAALGGIWIYQTYLSPRKGFRCAYAVLHGGTGCSGFAKQAIQEHGAIAAIALVRDRFKACKAAHFTLRDDNENRPRKRRKGSWAETCFCSVGDAALSIPCSSGLGRAGGGNKTGGCDALDCNALDCGGCDACSCS